MPSRQRRKQPPSASRRKRFLYAFYLVQPFLQFAALMTVFFALSRCSPLSSSQDRSSLQKAVSDGVKAVPGDNLDQRAEEEDVKRELKEISSSDDLAVVSESEFEKLTEGSLNADRPTEPSKIRQIFQGRPRLRREGSTRILTIHLTSQQRNEIGAGSGLKKPIPLAERLRGVAMPSADLRKAFFGELHRLSRLEAKIYLVLPDDALQDHEAPRALPIATKSYFFLLPSQEKAFLSVHREEKRLDDQQQELIRSYLEKSVYMAIVLE